MANDQPVPPGPVDDLDPGTGLPRVPRVGDGRVPSIGQYEDALVRLRDDLRRRNTVSDAGNGLSGGKRGRAVTLHFTKAEYALLEACAAHTGEEVAPFVRRVFFAKLRELFP